MNNILFELFSHQSWADALHWKAFESLPDSLNDESIRKRLYHIHIVQNGYLSIFKNAPFRYRKPEDFKNMEEIKQYGSCFHKEMLILINEIQDEKLKEPVIIPWFSNPPLDINTEQAMMQVIMHSHYHRGQNAARLRELGGEPPNTDFVVWYWKGKPAAEW